MPSATPPHMMKMVASAMASAILVSLCIIKSFGHKHYVQQLKRFDLLFAQDVGRTDIITQYPTDAERMDSCVTVCTGTHISLR